MAEQTNPVVVFLPTKSMGLSLLLTFFFGPFGMLYSTIMGGVIMLIVSFVVGFFTLGFGHCNPPYLHYLGCGCYQ